MYPLLGLGIDASDIRQLRNEKEVAKAESNELDGIEKQLKEIEAFKKGKIELVFKKNKAGKVSFRKKGMLSNIFLTNKARKAQTVLAQELEKSLFQRKASILNHFKDLQKKVNQIIEPILEKLEKREQVTKDQQDAITTLFFQFLAPLPEKVFDRTKIGKGTKLEAFLSQKAKIAGSEILPRARKRYEELLAEPKAKLEKRIIKQADQIGEALIELIRSEGELAIALGVHPEAAGEASTSFYIRDISGKKIAIFKPEDLGPRSPLNPKIGKRLQGLFADKVLGQRSIRQARQYVAEEISHKVSLRLGALTTPPTKVVKMSSHIFAKEGKPLTLKTGSLQAFAPGCKTAKEVFGIQEQSWLKTLLRSIYEYFFGRSRSTTRIEEMTKEKGSILKGVNEALFTNFAVFDYVTGQIDRHFENWLIYAPQDPAKPESEGRIAIAVNRLFRLEKGHAIVAIDGGAAFPKGHIRTILETRNQYLEAELPLAETPVKKKYLHMQEGWQKKIPQDLLELSLKEDLPLRKNKANIKKALNRIIFQYSKNIGTGEPLPTRQEVEELIKKALPRLSAKNYTHLAKTVLQVLGTKERIAIIECFLNPPKGHEKEYTLRRLAFTATDHEISQFWKDHSKLVQR